ncbi:MAG: hypothetical protein ABJE95_13010 [Byssovorax sp.]
MASIAAASTASALDAGTTTPSVQSGSVSVGVPTRSATLRATTTKQNWISYKDCTDEIELTFPVAVSGATGASGTISAYASRFDSDCLLATTRGGSGFCKHLSVTNPTMGNPTVKIKVKDLNALFGISGCGEQLADGGAQDTSAIPLKFYFLLNVKSLDFVANTDNFAIYEDSGIDLWGPEPPILGSVDSGDEALQVNFTDGTNTDSDRVGYYVFLDDGLGDAGAPASTTTSAAAGAGATSGGGSGGAGASTSGSSSASTSAATGVGGASSSSTGAGVGGSGGAGGMSTSSSSSAATAAASSSSSAAASTSAGAGGSTSNGATTTTGSTMSTGVTSGGNTDACHPSGAVAACVPASSVLVAGQVPDGTGTGEPIDTGTVATVSSLVNGKAYVVAMAAYDDVGNVGKLSELKCGAPAPVDSILRVYQCTGGFKDSGCGFCSMGGDRGGSFAALVSGGLVVFGLAARRGRRKRGVRGARGAR